MSRGKVTLFASVAFVLAGCGGSSPTDPGGTAATLAGTAFSTTATALTAVTVIVAGQETTVAPDGSFHFASLPPGDVEVTAVAAGGGFGSASGTLHLPPGPSSLRIPFGDNDSGFLFGRVLDAATGRPIPGAVVQVADSTATDADGTYVLHACCSTIGEAVASAPGYETVTLRWLGRTYGGSRAVDFRLRPAG